MCLQFKCLIYAQAFCPVLIFTWLEETKQKTLAINPGYGDAIIPTSVGPTGGFPSRDAGIGALCPVVP